MRSPDGQEYPNRGMYLEVVENQRLVFTDAYSTAWEPSQQPFMTVILTFQEEAGKTRYTARVRHWTGADREMHEKMGFMAAGHSVRINSRRWSPNKKAMNSNLPQLRRGGDQRLGIGVTGRGKHSLRRPVFHDAALLHDIYAIRNRPHDVQIVRHE